MTEALIAFSLTWTAYAALVIWLWPKMRTPAPRPPLTPYERQRLLMRRAVDDMAVTIGVSLTPVINGFLDALDGAQRALSEMWSK